MLTGKKGLGTVLIGLWAERYLKRILSILQTMLSKSSQTLRRSPRNFRSEPRYQQDQPSSAPFVVAYLRVDA